MSLVELMNDAHRDSAVGNLIIRLYHHEIDVKLKMNKILSFWFLDLLRSELERTTIVNLVFSQ
jgi:hypothetical protein